MITRLVRRLFDHRFNSDRIFRKNRMLIIKRYSWIQIEIGEKLKILSLFRLKYFVLFTNY